MMRENVTREGVNGERELVLGAPSRITHHETRVPHHASAPIRANPV
ncbi:hypothetical protein GGQ08_000088 [Salinibacter ruber]|uniref:Uncharacterized protein n=1 Tax=Salinibacter ruber TaxID=146919 RepID=A0A9X2PUJ9_9BACT|nr:hypothetical protein [Salinibacter ruber]MCS3652048.1 hypothetical protein [Salinibacter ruber]MCS3859403.1 hypothetical protein [Salinibacter ruber]MCS3866283.1 hypothetical protein [Salinibacter ruber]MCS4151858.1 hypothetical protein [Salinibacter ruber]